MPKTVSDLALEKAGIKEEFTLEDTATINDVVLGRSPIHTMKMFTERPEVKLAALGGVLCKLNMFAGNKPYHYLRNHTNPDGGKNYVYLQNYVKDELIHLPKIVLEGTQGNIIVKGHVKYSEGSRPKMLFKGAGHKRMRGGADNRTEPIEGNVHIARPISQALKYSDFDGEKDDEVDTKLIKTMLRMRAILNGEEGKPVVAHKSTGSKTKLSKEVEALCMIECVYPPWGTTIPLLVKIVGPEYIFYNNYNSPYTPSREEAENVRLNMHLGLSNKQLGKDDENLEYYYPILLAELGTRSDPALWDIRALIAAGGTPAKSCVAGYDYRKLRNDEYLAFSSKGQLCVVDERTARMTDDYYFEGVNFDDLRRTFSYEKSGRDNIKGRGCAWGSGGIPHEEDESSSDDDY